MKILLKTIGLFFLFLPAVALGAPSIGQVAGTYNDGQNVIISGQSFGNHSLNIEWLGGTNGAIENGAANANFALNGWEVDSTSSARQAPVFSSERAHSGKKSIKSYFTQSAQYTSGFGFDTGAAQSRVYASWWVYLDWGGGVSGQWKMWRLRPDSSYGDTNGELMASSWYNSDGSHSQQYLMYFCDYANYDKCYPNSDGSLRWLGGSQAVDQGAWQRIELYAEASSSAGARDGSVVYLIHKQNEPVKVVRNDIGNVITRISGANDWRNFVFENYLGNITSGDDTVPKIYIDDIFIQAGSQARVEIGDASTWAGCKHREVQFPRSWSDSTIEFSMNTGSYAANQQAYLYVVDASGAVNPQGYAITIGSTGVASDAPAQPKNLKFQPAN